MLSHRLFDTPDYPMLQEWCGLHGYPLVPRVNIPPNSLVVSYNNIDVFFLAVYLCDGKISWVTMPVSNKTVPMWMINRSYEYALKTAEEIVLQRGLNIIFSTTTRKSVGNKLEANGYTKGDEVTEFVKVLEEQ